jgi:hypothetical protein
MLVRGMADSERVDRRPEQLANCCYGLACIDALARRKRLLVTTSWCAGVVVSARVVASWGVVRGNRSHRAARHKVPRSSSSRRWHNSIAYSTPLSRRDCLETAPVFDTSVTLRPLQTLASYQCRLRYHGGYEARVSWCIVNGKCMHCYICGVRCPHMPARKMQ